jgi:hypothetical protein
VLPGFKIDLYADGFRDPRFLLTAPNGDIFAAFHGSWNRMKRTAYKVVRVPFDHSTGKARDEYEDFVTGLLRPRAKSGVARWESPLQKMAAFASAKTATAPSGA